MDYASIPATLVFYESPRRVGKSLRDMAQCLGADRQAALCRELTKKFEEVHRDALGELAAVYENETPKGEIVLVIGAAPEREDNPEKLEGALKQALKDAVSLRDAVDDVVAELGLPRKQVYQQALKMAGNK